MAFERDLDGKLGRGTVVLIHEGKREVAFAMFLDALQRLHSPSRVGLASFIGEARLRQLLHGKVRSIIQQAQPADVHFLHVPTQMNGHRALAIRTVVRSHKRQDYRLPFCLHLELRVAQLRILRRPAHLDAGRT